MESDHQQVSMTDTETVEEVEFRKHLPLTVNPTERRRMGLPILAPAVCILIIAAGSGSALVSYLSLKSVSGQTLRSVLSNGTLLIDEGSKTLATGQEEVQLRALLVTSLAGHLIGWSVPFVMSIIAFRLSADWLDSQGQDQKLPTPEQYGLLLQMCSSSSLKSLFAATVYFGKLSKRPAIPLIVTQAFIILATATTLSFAISLVDTWLHAVASAAFFSQTIPVANMSDPSLAFGVGFNNISCGSDEIDGLCTQPSTGIASSDGDLLNRGFEVAGNASKIFSVSTLNDMDWMAILTTKGIPPNTVYVAETLGMTASCINLAPGCEIGNRNPALQSNINCSATVPEDRSFPEKPTTYFELYKSGIPVLRNLPPTPQLEENPKVFNALMQLVYPPTATSNFGNITSPNPAIIYEYQSAFLLANCTLTVFDVTIESKPATNNTEQGQIQTVISRSKASSSPTNSTSQFWPGILYGGIGNFLTTNTFDVATTSTSAEEVLAALSQEIARLTLAFASGSLQPIPAQEVSTVEKRLVSSYPILPLITFLILLFLYAAVTLAVYIWCAFASSPVVHVRTPTHAKEKRVPLMSLLHSHLTSPLSIVAMLYTHPSTQGVGRSKSQLEYLERQTHTSRLFSENADTARLYAEVIINSATQERYFELCSRRIHPESALEKGEETTSEEQHTSLLAGNTSFDHSEFNPYEGYSNTEHFA